MRNLYLLVFALLLACEPSIDYPDRLEQKVKGLVFTGPGRGPLQDQMFSSMADIGANFVAVVPEATVYRQNLEVVYDFENQWFGEKKQATLEGIAYAKANGLEVMLKPHLTIGWDMAGWDRPEVDFGDSLSRINYALSAREFMSGQESKIEGTSSWRGELMTTDDKAWATFVKGYEDYILDYAGIADSLDVALFCIGTEMKRTALEKPDFWRQLIRKVRRVYKGPITYAANWDSYDQISFWDELDYIGVDAYFPLSEAEKPTYAELKTGWEKQRPALSALTEKFQKRIILTEWGYENEDYVGTEPWIMGRYKNTVSAANNTAQANAYRSMFDTIWDAPWMKGVFVWRWSPNETVSPGPNYSPRGKEAALVLLEIFKE